ncbi:MAG: ubiquitin [Clostridiales bacterium]|nr:ubiquitin [Clostridiales bacterium]
MDHFEMVEKLREKANVSYEDAKTALEVSGWDLLDALVYLEKEGKIQEEASASYTTRQEPRPAQPRADDSAKGVMARLFEALATLINRINRIQLEVRHRGKVLYSIPLLAYLLLLGFAFWFTIGVMVISLFFGVTYRFKGADGVNGVNRVMDKAADMADNIRTGNREQNKE